MHEDILAEVAQLDAVTPEEELELLKVDAVMQQLETCTLSVNDRVLHDTGSEEGWAVGTVESINEEGRFTVRLDGLPAWESKQTKGLKSKQVY